MGRDLQGYIKMKPHNRRRARSPRRLLMKAAELRKWRRGHWWTTARHPCFSDRPFAKARSDHAGMGRDLAGKDPRVDVGTALAQPPESRLYGVA